MQILRHLSPIITLLQHIVCNTSGHIRADIKTPLSYNNAFKHMLCNMPDRIRANIETPLSSPKNHRELGAEGTQTVKTHTEKSLSV